MRKSKILAVLMVMVILVTTFAACGSKEEAATSSSTQAASSSTVAEVKKDPVTINFSWWGEKARHDGTLAAVKLWNEKNPEIQVETYYSGWDEYNQKIETQFASGTAPDLFQFSAQKLKQYASQGQLLDLSANVDKDFSGIDKGLWNGVSVDGKPYGVSAGTNSIAMAYNKTKLEQFGIALPTDNETWDSLLEKSKAATKDTNGDGKIDVWGMPPLMDSTLEQLYPFFRQNGVEMWKEDLKGSNFGDPKVLESLKKFEEFHKQGLCVPTDVTLPEGLGYLTAGYSVFEISTLSAYPASQELTKDELGLVAYPVVAGGTEAREMSSGLPIGIYSKSENQEAAIKFLSWFLTDPEAAKTAGMIRGIFPSTAQREATSATLAVPQQQAMRVANFVSALGINKGYPYPLHVGEFTDIWTQEIGKYNFGQVTLEEFLQNIMKNADPVLNQD